MNIRDYLKQKKKDFLKKTDPVEYLDRALNEMFDLFENALNKVQIDTEDLNLKTSTFLEKITGTIEEKKQSLVVYITQKADDVLDQCISYTQAYLEAHPAPKGDKGDSYVLTEQDKFDIAKSVEVPKVEKIIERREVIVEKPLITNVIKEVAVAETTEKIVDKLNTSKDSIAIYVIRGLQKELEDIKRTIRRRNQISGGGGGAGGGTSSTVTVSDSDPVGSATDGDIHLVTDDGTTGGVVIKTFLYDGAWIDTTEPDYEKCKNVTGSTIAKGKVVYVNGANGSLPTITLADSSTETTSSKTVGITAKSITNNSDGYFIRSGLLIGIDTSTFSAGDTLWLGTTGNITNIRPTAPNHAVFVGYTLTSAANGRMLVSIMNGYELDELHNVSITTPANGQVLTYESATGLWKNQTPSGGGSSFTFTTTEVNVGTTPRRNGYFTITTTGLTSGKSVLIQQAVGPYTGKGTLADEAEMDGLTVSASTTSTTTIKAYWTSASPVRGNFKFNYLVSA